MSASRAQWQRTSAGKSGATSAGKVGQKRLPDCCALVGANCWQAVGSRWIHRCRLRARAQSPTPRPVLGRSPGGTKRRPTATNALPAKVLQCMHLARANCPCLVSTDPGATPTPRQARGANRALTQRPPPRPPAKLRHQPMFAPTEVCGHQADTPPSMSGRRSTTMRATKLRTRMSAVSWSRSGRLIYPAS